MLRQAFYSRGWPAPSHNGFDYATISGTSFEQRFEGLEIIIRLRQN